MRLTVLAAASLAAATLGACTMSGGEGAAARPAGTAPTPGATATLVDGSGGAKGEASFTDTGSGVRLTVQAMGLTPGEHGIHVHTVGACTGPDFASAGPHWNPTGKMHGTQNPQGPHGGDLPNIVIGADGTGYLEATLAGASLASGATPLLDADGAAIVIHAAADDYKTDPSGSSGGRIACGVLKAG